MRTKTGWADHSATCSAALDRKVVEAVETGKEVYKWACYDCEWVCYTVTLPANKQMRTCCGIVLQRGQRVSDNKTLIPTGGEHLRREE